MMEKSYYIEYEDRGDYLYVLVGGEKLTAEISKIYWREIAHKAFNLKKLKILIEKDFKESVSPPEMLEMGNYLGYLLPTFTIAFVDRFSHDDVNQLGKMVARHREVIMQLFDSVENAERWLRVN
ncbi:MAG TPA: hypothetical protein VIL74_20250 [Pyrinomonadaceae bacterium]|jgi:hypothetical protein